MAARVLLTDGEERATLAATRCLASAGYETIVAAFGKPAAAQWSRSCHERLDVPSAVADPDSFVHALAARVARGDVSIVIPGGDASLCAISRRRDQLEPHVLLGLPGCHDVERSVDKLALADVAAACGLPCPPSVICASSDDAVAAANDLAYPVVVKPRRSVFTLGGSDRQRSSTIVWNEAQLAQVVAELGLPCILQQREDGSVYSCSGVYVDGGLLGFAASRYRRTFPPQGGAVAFGETITAPSELVERIGAFVGGLGWRGIFEVELVRGRDGTLGVIDMNPRIFGSMTLPQVAGAPLPALWCDWLLGRRPEPCVAGAGMRYRWEDADARHFVWQARRGHVRDALDVLHPRPRTVHAFFQLHDPLPLTARLAYMAGSGVRHTRQRHASEPRRDTSTEVSSRSPRATRPQARARHMSARLAPRRPVVVIGAGPYGLSAAAHLRAAGVETRIFGRVMEFWHENMPKGMILRSRIRSSNIADPGRAHTIAAYGGIDRGPLQQATLESFREYAHWFQRETVPDIDSRDVVLVEPLDGQFALTLDDGEVIEADRVVVAVGLSRFARRPDEFASLPPRLASHSSEHRDLSVFDDRKVIVIGGGQSALESAALLHEGGAHVEIVLRAPSIRWLASDCDDRSLMDRLAAPTDVGGKATSWAAAFPDVFRHMPQRYQPVIGQRCVRPAGAGWLRPRLDGVPIMHNTSVVSAVADNGHLRIELDSGARRVVDHALLATGYAVDVSRYPFLSPQLLAALEVVGGYPRLGPGLESSVPGLHFLGAPAAMSFGPIMRFVVGTWYAAPTLSRQVQGLSPRPIRASF